MMDFWIELPIRLQHILEKEDLKNTEKILTISNVALMNYGFTKQEVQLIKKSVAKKYSSTFTSAKQYSLIENNKWKKLSFGCAAIDSLMKSGVPNYGITEISGEAGAGKSQLCLQLALTVQLAEENGGFGKGAAFICTEDAFPSRRLYQMAQNFLQRYGNHSFLDKIFIEHITDSDKLLECVSVRLPQLLQQESIGLIVIDSVAAVYRVEPNAIDRAIEMRRLAQALQSLAHEHQCVVICVNQVTSVIDDSGQNKVVPCLGLAWSNLVTTRIQIHKKKEIVPFNITQDQATTSTQNPLIIRKFEIIFSPELPQSSTEFAITEGGVVNT